MNLDSLKGLADPTRRRIAERLSGGGLPVAELAAEFPMSRPAVSKHLRVMRELGLVVERREGRQRIYELAAEPLEEIVSWLESLARAGGARRGLLASESAEDAEPAAGRRRPSVADKAGADAEPVDETDAHWRSW